MERYKKEALEVAMLYVNGTEQERATILSCFPENEKAVFLRGVGAIHLFNDRDYYKAVEKALCDKTYNELCNA